MSMPILFAAIPAAVQSALSEQGLGPPLYPPLKPEMAGLNALLPECRLVLASAAAGLPDQLAVWRGAGLRAPVLLLGIAEDGWEVTETLPLPVRLGALISRMRFYASMAQELALDPIQWGGYIIDPVQKTLCHADANQVLTDKELAILLLLAQSDEALSREELLRVVWGYDADLETHTLETHIYRLRRKLAELGGDGDIITTPAGYQLTCT